jgi:hypothetical protein
MRINLTPCWSSGHGKLYRNSRIAPQHTQRVMTTSMITTVQQQQWAIATRQITPLGFPGFETETNFGKLPCDSAQNLKKAIDYNLRQRTEAWTQQKGFCNYYHAKWYYQGFFEAVLMALSEYAGESAGCPSEPNRNGSALP